MVKRIITGAKHAAWTAGMVVTGKVIANCVMAKISPEFQMGMHALTDLVAASYAGYQVHTDPDLGLSENARTAINIGIGGLTGIDIGANFGHLQYSSFFPNAAKFAYSLFSKGLEWGFTGAFTPTLNAGFAGAASAGGIEYYLRNHTDGSYQNKHRI